MAKTKIKGPGRTRSATAGNNGKAVAKRKPAALPTTHVGPSAIDKYRQMTIDWDFQQAEFEPDEERRLREIATDTRRLEESFLLGGVEVALKRGEFYAEARTLFGKTREDISWPAYCKDVLGYSRQTIDRQITLYEAMHEYDPALLAGVEMGGIHLLARKETRKPQIRKVLKLAETERVSTAAVKKMLGLDDKQLTSFDVAKPDTDEAVKALLVKKIDGIRKRIDEELAGHVPDILREIAEELNGK